MEKMLVAVEKIAAAAGRKLLEFYGDTDCSARATPKEMKTIYDRIADEMIIAAIKADFPDHSYLTEETGFVGRGNEYLWIVDPLDGTANYVNKNPFFAVSISVWRRGEPVVSVVEAPCLKERYVALTNTSGSEAFLYRENGEKIRMRVSQNAELNRSYLLYCEGGAADKERILQMISPIYAQVKGMRILGSAALELLWVALGRAEAYFTPQISLWDIAAGVHILRAAGGKVLHFDLQEWKNADLLKAEAINLLASNGRIVLPPLRY